MTNDELATAFQDLFTQAHAAVDALPDDHTKVVAQRLLSMFHNAGNVFASHLSDNDVIQPMAGTDKP